jgi:hypothetical protein
LRGRKARKLPSSTVKAALLQLEVEGKVERTKGPAGELHFRASRPITVLSREEERARLIEKYEEAWAHPSYLQPRLKKWGAIAA